MSEIQIATTSDQFMSYFNLRHILEKVVWKANTGKELLFCHVCRWTFVSIVLLWLWQFSKQETIKINEPRLILIHARGRLMGEASGRDDYNCPCPPMTNGTVSCLESPSFLNLLSGIKTLLGYHHSHQRQHHHWHKHCHFSVLFHLHIRSVFVDWERSEKDSH